MSGHLPGESDPLPEAALQHLSYLNSKINRIEQLEAGLKEIVEWCGTDDGGAGVMAQEVLDGERSK